MRRIPRTLTVLAAAALVAPAAAPAASGDPGGFWSLLPAGQGSTADAFDVAAHLTLGTVPDAFQSQRAMFEALPAAAPDVATGDIGRFFKPAPIGGAAVTTVSPRAGVTIARDEHNVPHVTGVTREDVMWGAGYAAAADRLFFIDVLRHTARGRLTELIGPGPDGETAAADAAQLGVTDYSEEDLQRMLDAGGADPEGAQALADVAAYVDGVNAYIAAARADPDLMPGEYAALGKPLEDFRATDAVAILGLVNGYFGRGGGVELDNALIRQEARKRFGARRGARVVRDFRSFEDPEAPVTTTRRFPFDRPGRPSRRAIAIPDPGSLRHVDRIRPEGGEGAGARAGVPAWLAALRRRGGLRLPRHASNAMAIPARESQAGVPLLVAGPQVDFYAPPLFMEISLEGPGIAARGAAVPGAGPYVVIGHGRDFAWSITTAQGDNTDTFAERLCEPDGSEPTMRSAHYVRGDRCVALEVREEQIAWDPGPADLAADPAAQPYRATVRTERSVHGPIIARATVGGAPVAYALARATWFQELRTAVAFLRLDAGVSGPREFQRAAALATGSYNFLYADREHAAYIQSGIYPRRARGVHPDLPAWGDGHFDWRGFDPRTKAADYLPVRRLPQDIDPARGYLISWNNKQAPGWRASDYDWEYGPVHRSQRLERRVRAAIRGRRKLDLGRLVGIMGDAGTVDVRGQEVLPWLLRVLGEPGGDAGRGAAVLRAWLAGGAHRRDRDGDGFYDQSAAVALMDAWWEPMVRAVYEPVLGAELIERIAHVNPIDYLPVDGPDTWFYGWMGYVQKDMRALLRRPIAQPPSRVYCGRGSRSRCRARIAATLAAAVREVERRQGSLDAVRLPATCPVTDPPQCDQLDFIAAGAIAVAPTAWQDRGSFQQAVEVGAAHGG